MRLNIPLPHLPIILPFAQWSLPTARSEAATYSSRGGQRSSLSAPVIIPGLVCPEQLRPIMSMQYCISKAGALEWDSVNSKLSNQQGKKIWAKLMCMPSKRWLNEGMLTGCWSYPPLLSLSHQASRRRVKSQPSVTSPQRARQDLTSAAALTAHYMLGSCPPLQASTQVSVSACHNASIYSPPWASEMAQQIKALVTKSDDLSFRPGSHTVEG